MTATRPSMQGAMRPVARDDWSSLALLTCVGIALFAIQLTGAENLLDNEYRLGACVLDVLQHGNWLCPHDVLGNTDKPPMLTWLAALASWPIGRVTTFTLYLPTALATLGTSWLIALAGGRRFGRRAGLFGGLAFLLSQFAARQMATARWDGLFALTVTVAALAAFRAWTLGRGWTVFWLAAAIATLTKGPLGVVFAGFGLMAAVWERVDGRRKPFEGTHLVGIVLFLLLTVGWFLLAYRRVGPHLVHNMFLDEFVGHGQHRSPTGPRSRSAISPGIRPVGRSVLGSVGSSCDPRSTTTCAGSSASSPAGWYSGWCSSACHRTTRPGFWCR